MLANASSIPGYVWPALASRPEYDCSTPKLPVAADDDGASVGRAATAVFLGATIGGATTTSGVAGGSGGEARSTEGRAAAPPVKWPSRNENVPVEPALGGSGLGGRGGGTGGGGITGGGTSGGDGGSAGAGGRDAARSTNAGSASAGYASPTTTRPRFDAFAGFALGGGSERGAGAASATAVAADCAALDALDAIVAVRRSASVMLYSR